MWDVILILKKSSAKSLYLRREEKFFPMSLIGEERKLDAPNTKVTSGIQTVSAKILGRNPLIINW